jgi:pteridine reductase
LVTGGARRLGRYISYFLAGEGYNLAIIYNSSSQKELSKTSKKLDSFGIKYKFYKCDLRDIKALKKTVNRIGSDFRKIDVLVNNAGIIKKIDFTEITEKVLDNFINTNLKAALFTSQFSLKYLEKSKSPLIINIASLGGLQNWTNYIPYGISKAGIIKLTYLLAKRLAPKIRVNAIAPGTIIIKGEETGITEKTPVKRIPLKKYGSPDDIVEAVKFLINSPYIAGQVIPVDGGRLLN